MVLTELCGGMENAVMNGKHLLKLGRKERAVRTAQERECLLDLMILLPYVPNLLRNGRKKMLMQTSDLTRQVHRKKSGGKENAGMSGRL